MKKFKKFEYVDRDYDKLQISRNEKDTEDLYFRVVNESFTGEDLIAGALLTREQALALAARIFDIYS